MKNSLKRVLTTVLVIIMVITSMKGIDVKAASPKKLDKSDFVFTCSGKQDFIKLSKSYSFNAYAYASLSGGDDKNVKVSVKDFKTKRGVVDGSSLSFVKKKYGNQTLKKITNKTNFYKIVKYDMPSLDISTWKSYLSYNYQKGQDKYQIIFVFNKKNKVFGVVFLKNEQEAHNYPDNEVGDIVKFTAPDGKAVKTTTIAGKKVYLLPKGATISYDEKIVNKLSKEKVSMELRHQVYDTYGNLIGSSDSNFRTEGKMEDCLLDIYAINPKTGESVKNKNGKYKVIELKDGVPYYATCSYDYESGEYKKNVKFTNKKVDYSYYLIYMYPVSVDKVDYAPVYVYFRFV